MNLRRFGRQFVAKWLIRFFTSAIRGVILWEATLAKQEECKHEGQNGNWCGLCGKALKEEGEVELEETIERVLRRVLGVPSGKAAPDKTRTTLADRLGVGKKK